MSSFDPVEYKGNRIFRNQPHHSYFDKPFDEHDCLFQHLNEIEPHFLKPEQQADEITLQDIAIIDPRTEKPITQLHYDYTKEEETQIFYSPRNSMMTKEQHKMGLVVLNDLQQCLEIDEEDMYNWYRLERTRITENQNFQMFVLEFSQNNKEQMYAPCRKLLELYQKWYKDKANKLIKRYDQEMYNTHLGLPQVKLCKNVLSEQQVKIINQEVVNIVGEKCFWHNDMKEELKKLNKSISAYFEIFQNSEDLKESMEDDLKLQFLKIVEQELNETPYLYMPLESLLFLLTTGEYVDIPTEMLLNIKETHNLEGDLKKYIVMDLPLPSRQCGWHTYKQVVEHAAIAMLSLKQTNIKKECSKNIMKNSTDYRVFSVQDYMENSVHKADKLFKFSKTLTKWQLATLENDSHLQIFTSFDSFIEDKSIFLKLEFKPKFGCEVLTKYEILKAWFKLKLSGASDTNCMRLDVTNYKTLLEEPISLIKLEENLLSIYHINCNQLLINLFEFLKLLCNMPSGQYMLRYNSKYKEKIMLCKPSQEITQNTIDLHKLLNTNATDTEFMAQQNFLPIDKNLCSIMHLQHEILPAAFFPRGNKQKRCFNNHAFKPRQKNKVVPPKKEQKKPILNKSKMKRIRRRRRKLAAEQTKRNEQQELENEIELDRKMLNFR